LTSEKEPEEGNIIDSVNEEEDGTVVVVVWQQQKQELK
jgi:hypothetical protein